MCRTSKKSTIWDKQESSPHNSKEWRKLGLWWISDKPREVHCRVESNHIQTKIVYERGIPKDSD